MKNSGVSGCNLSVSPAHARFDPKGFFSTLFSLLIKPRTGNRGHKKAVQQENIGCYSRNTPMAQ